MDSTRQMRRERVTAFGGAFMDGEKADAITGAGIGGENTHVRIEYLIDGKRRFIDFPVDHLHQMLPALFDLSNPRGESISTLAVSDLDGFLQREFLLLNLTISGGGRITFSIPLSLVAPLADIAKRGASSSIGGNLTH